MMILRILIITISLLGLMIAQVSALETTARSALVIDYNTGTVLLSKNADVPMPPASMSKLMTLNMIFEALDDGRLTLEDTFRVSAKASQKGGSKMFVREGARVRIEDLIRGVIVQSGNDACIVLAEGLAGTEDAFAKRMTLRARELGMENSNFVNSTGWPDPGHKMSSEDLVFLAGRLIEKFPQYYTYFTEKTFTWENIVQNNRNPLLTLGIGADGLKTGHTAEAGYGLVGSAVSKGRRIIFMVGGLDSALARSSEAERIARWAFREFEMKTLFQAGTPVDRVNVWLGAEKSVEIALSNEIELLLPLKKRDKITAHYTYNDPVEAPISTGQKLGELIITIPNRDPMHFPLTAVTSVEAGGFLERISAAADILLRRIRAATSGG
ncbi:MAG: D-alanyl-D-alanine carboxypeptidase family protein [Paracoccaceae bacterium]